MDPDRWNSLTPAQQDAFLNGPALAPPAGVKSNFVDPPNHNATVIGVTTMCVALAAVMVLLRAYSKLCVSKKVNIEDVLGLIAFGTYVGAIWSILHAVHLGGFFVHQWDVTFGVFQNVLYVGLFLDSGFLRLHHVIC
ncbi:hypothetical protein BKA67DRAFT_111382 [Truncatella angustata]|uniref:Uncharacterized protein n=1 Tax=Truncatella angustata TaxID=152316 RepID=A0A9P8RG59_9PEZI|nr:uncharacterized protein BKA67DRAFT_111382 [Truncatella angustata]KAH6645399.1 hypothetical protein BKA67DRAFT_111382 [Truncatella angustata]